MDASQIDYSQRVSVIVPVYNVELYLARCLDSILSQDYENIEIVVVNDGSTDGSLTILKQYCADQRNIILVDQANAGLSEARNAGMRASSGELIFFIDSDDYLMPGSISGLVKSLTQDVDICELPVYDAYDTHHMPSAYQTPSSISHIDLADNPACLFQIAVYAWGKLYRRSLIDDLPFPKGLMHEDNYVATCLLPRLRKIVKIDQGGYCYYQRSTSITAAYNTNMYDMIAVQQAIYDTYDRLGYLESYRLLCERMAVRNLCVAILGKKMARIKPELRSTRKKAYQAITSFMKTCYPDWKSNPYVTTKERIFVSLLLSNYHITTWIWKGVSQHHG